MHRRLVLVSFFASDKGAAAEFTNAKRGYRLTYPDSWQASPGEQTGEPLERTIELGPITYKTTAIAARIDGKQFLFQLEYHGDDPNGMNWERTLVDVVASVAIVPDPPEGAAR